MSRIISRALPLAVRSPLSSLAASRCCSHPPCDPLPRPNLLPALPFSSQTRRFRALSGSPRVPARHGAVFASHRGFRKSRLGPSGKKKTQKPPTGRELQLSVLIGIEESLPDDPEVQNIAEMLKLNAPMALKVALDGINNPDYKTRACSISNVAQYEKVELSLLLCNDEFIRQLNREWRNEDHATDVLSMSCHIPDLKIPILMLGDIVISIETAERQAKERGHTILDEIRILLVHGLLHLLGFDHEISIQAEEEMEKEEGLILNSLKWKGKGLISSANDTVQEVILEENPNGTTQISAHQGGSLRFYRPKYKYIFCDMDGTLLNSRSQVTPATAEALREATSRGVKVVVATGKARPAVIRALRAVNLAGKDGIVSEDSPGVFLQGLLVYGRQGKEVARRNLDPNICREAFMYSLENKTPLVAFCQDRCLTLFDHPYIESLHTVYHEPKAEVMTSVEHLLGTADVQKLLFFGTDAHVTNDLRPYWSGVAKGRAGITQAQSDMLEIIPYGTSKGAGVKMLLDHLDIHPEEIMAIGDGENDVEMLQLASLGIALENGSEKAKAVADVIGSSNDEDGVAEAIYKYAF